MVMVHRLSLWAGPKSRSRRKKLISVREEHLLPYQRGLITDSVPELLVDITFQIIFIEIGTRKQRAMICSISCGERFSFTQRIDVCTLSSVLSSEVRDWRDSPLNPWKKYSLIIAFLSFSSFHIFIIYYC